VARHLLSLGVIPFALASQRSFFSGPTTTSGLSTPIIELRAVVFLGEQVRLDAPGFFCLFGFDQLLLRMQPTTRASTHQYNPF
jgi:hypothetical protein